MSKPTTLDLCIILGLAAYGTWGPMPSTPMTAWMHAEFGYGFSLFAIVGAIGRKLLA